MRLADCFAHSVLISHFLLMLEFVLGCATSLVLKGAYDELKSTMRAGLCAKRALPFILQKNEDRMSIVDTPVSDYLRYDFGSTTCGMFVLGGPFGCGKSTMLHVAINNFRSSDSRRNLLYFDNGSDMLRDRNLHRTLGVEVFDDLSNFLPPGTVIVLDHACFTSKTLDVGYL